ncbi:MAG: tyrosine-protein phosphatase [Tannerellaceae bacterium]|jgi:protein-tyrosine phosphatase|nr:tyrosine-protein phosphatase [Tannerellaceae bacterium]
MIAKFSPLCFAVALTACSTGYPPQVYTACERDPVGNFLIKWESFYSMVGKVDIYISGDPNNFDLRRPPVLSANVEDCVATYVTPDNISRQYFRLIFENGQAYTVGERPIKMDSVPNLRDIGGYFASGGGTTRWGMVYRSGSLGHLSLRDSLRLANLHLRTIIDMRSATEMASSPLFFANARIVRLPLTINTLSTASDGLRTDRLRRGDATIHMQDAYLRFVSENTPAFSAALREFLIRDNYPILVTCTFGKDACGFFSSLLLAALGIPESTILDDYLETGLTFEHIIPHLGFSPGTLSAGAIDAALVLLSADESFLTPIHDRVRKDYGSFESFLSGEFGLSPSDRTHLKNILLR